MLLGSWASGVSLTREVVELPLVNEDSASVVLDGFECGAAGKSCRIVGILRPKSFLHPSASGHYLFAMSPRRITPLLLFLALSAFSTQSRAAISLAQDAATSATASANVSGPAKEAIEAFQAGRYAKAIGLAQPLVEQGNADALYLMGFAYETGKGFEASREKALEYYRKASAGKQSDATYRLSFILLASDKEEERNEARAALEKSAKDDPTVAGRILGEAFLRGRLSPTADPDKAIFWWNQAADAGDITSLLLIARFYEGQFGFPELKDNAKAFAIYGKAAGLGDFGAMAALGSRLLGGDEKLRDEAKGREWLKKAVEGKNYAAYLALGDYEESVKKDLKAALKEYERGKDAGQVDCTLRAAEFYIQGKGVEKDEARGYALLQKVAESGNPLANFKLAVQAFSAEKPDLLAGYKYILASASGSLPEAQNELGLLYLSGKLGAADPAAGVAWLTRAAQGGNTQAQSNLAALYERGAAGLTQNIETAGQLYTLAANQGHGPSTLALARLVNEGLGTKADPVKAWALAALAQERGEKEANTLLIEISGKLDEAQKEAAKSELQNIKSAKAPTPAAKPAPAAAPKKTR